MWHIQPDKREGARVFVKSHKSESKGRIYGIAWSTFLMLENGDKKPKPDTRWNRLARVLTHLSKFIMKSTILTNAAREQWPIHTNFDKSPSDLFTWTLTGIYPPLNTGSIAITEYFHFSPQMWTVCDSHVKPAHVRILPPWAKSSHAKQIFALKPNYTTLSIRGNRNYIIYERQQITVLRSFQETLEIDLKSKRLQALEANPVCYLSHIFPGVIIQLHLFMSKTFFSILYISSSFALFWSTFLPLNSQIKLNK